MISADIRRGGRINEQADTVGEMMRDMGLMRGSAEGRSL